LLCSLLSVYCVATHIIQRTNFSAPEGTKEHHLVYEPWASRVLPVTFGYQVLSFNGLSTGGCTVRRTFPAGWE